MDRWTEYIYQCHPRSALAAWAPTLQWFRYCRALRGHTNDGDRLLVALRVPDRAALERTCATLGIALAPLPAEKPEPFAGALDQIEPLRNFNSAIPSMHGLAQPGHVRIGDVAAFVRVNGERLEISITDEEKPYEVTDAAIAAARRLEEVLAPLAGQLIEPPQDNRHCVCPDYYPELWGLAPGDEAAQAPPDATAPKTRERWSLKATFMAALIIIAFDFALVRGALHRPLWQELEIAAAAVGLFVWVALSLMLYAGVRMDRDHRWTYWSRGGPGSWGGVNVNVTEHVGGDDLASALLSLILSIVATIVVSFIVTCLLWIGVEVIYASLWLVFGVLFAAYHWSLRWLIYRHRRATGRASEAIWGGLKGAVLTSAGFFGAALLAWRVGGH